MRWEATQFAMAATNWNDVGRTVVSGLSQPRETESLYRALVAT